MKSAEPSTETSKKPRGEVSTTAPAFVDQPTAEEIVVGFKSSPGFLP